MLGRHYVTPTTAGTSSELNDLKEYFRRPRIIASGNIPTSRGSVKTVAFNSATFNTMFPDGNKRLIGATGLRAKVVYTLQIACSAFHQGIMVMCWQYGDGSNQTFKRYEYTGSTTSLPHVRLDVSSSTMSQMSIPYLNTSEYLDLSETWAHGHINLNSLTAFPLPTGAGAPTYKLYIHLEDLQLIGANPYARTNLTPQAGRQLSPLADEAEKEGFPFSSAGFALSRTVRWIAKGVPSLSSIAGPTAWAIGRASGALRAFGFSKPQIVEPYSRMIKRVNVAENNVDVPSNTNVIGALACNTLAVNPRFGGSDVDEMALSYVLAQYSQVCNFTFSTSVVSAAAIYATRVSPSYMWLRAPSALPAGNFPAPTGAGASRNGIYPSNLFYWASAFRYWRGSFKYRFTFAKTKFHGGRVMAAFIPSRTIGLAASNTANTVQGPEIDGVAVQPFGYTAIFDLRDGAVFEFEVPYISEIPFIRFNEDIGSLTLSVLDPLIGTGSVANFTSVIVEVAGGSDFELSCPCGPRYPAFDCDATGVQPDIRLQSGKPLSTVADDDNQMTMGERITSVKQLAMIPKVTQITMGANVLRKLFRPPPWWWTPNQPGTNVVYSAPPSESFGFSGYVAAAYVFVRGSTDYHVYGAESNSSCSITSALSPSEGPLDAGLGNVNQLSISSAPRVIDRANAHLRAPIFQKRNRLLSSTTKGVVWNTTSLSAPQWSAGLATNHNTFYELDVRVKPGFDIDVFFSRAAADDASASGYMGPPCLYLPAISGGAGTVWDSDSTFFRQV